MLHRVRVAAVLALPMGGAYLLGTLRPSGLALAQATASACFAETG